MKSGQKQQKAGPESYGNYIIYKINGPKELNTLAKMCFYFMNHQKNVGK